MNVEARQEEFENIARMERINLEYQLKREEMEKEKARAKDVESTISQKNLEVKLNLLKYGAEFFICGAMKSAPK